VKNNYLSVFLRKFNDLLLLLLLLLLL